MKAISIKQPWASLIAHGIKDIENRTWPCPKKYIGQRVLIHASQRTANFWDSTPEIYKIADNFISEISKSGTDWSHHRQCNNSRLRAEPSIYLGRERSMELGTEGCGSI